MGFMGYVRANSPNHAAKLGSRADIEEIQQNTQREMESLFNFQKRFLKYFPANSPLNCISS